MAVLGADSFVGGRKGTTIGSSRERELKPEIEGFYWSRKLEEASWRENAKERNGRNFTK